MNIYVDENIPLMTVKALREKGHAVYDHRGTPIEGISDGELWKLVQQKRCLLITTDKGFAKHRNEGHHGILIIRLRKPNRRKIHERVMGAINQFPPDEWPGLVVVIKDNVQSIWTKKNS